MKKFITIIVLYLALSFIPFNKINAQEDEHTHLYDNGICVCGEYEEAEYNGRSGFIVDNVGKLMWYAENYNNGTISNNLIIAANMTLPDGLEWIPIGTLERPFRHFANTYMDTKFEINLNNQEVKSSNYGLFGVTESKDIVITSITDIIVSGNFNITTPVEGVGSVLGTNKADSKVIITNCESYVNYTCSEDAITSSKIGGIVGNGQGTVTIEKCTNNGSITLDYANDSIGGIAGYMEKGSIANSINKGSISSTYAKHIGGIIGNVASAEFNGLINSANIGTVEGRKHDITIDATIYEESPGSIVGFIGSHDSSLISNNYYVDGQDYGLVTDAVYTDATKVSSEDIESGKLAYLLGKEFGQKLDKLNDDEIKDVYPIVGGDVVYEVKQCDEVTIMYSNFNENQKHDFVLSASGNTIYHTCNSCSVVKKTELLAPSNIHYDKTVKEAIVVSELDDFDSSQIQIIYDNEPLFPGVYNASFTYEGLTAHLEFEIKKGIPEVSMFTRINEDLDNLIYDGKPKHIEFYTTNELGMGNIHYKIVNSKGIVPEIKDAGYYTIRLMVEEGAYYQAHEFDLDGFILLEVQKKEITLRWTKTTLFMEEGKTHYTPEYEFIGTFNNYQPIGTISTVAYGKGTYTATISIHDDNYKLVGDNLTTEFTVKGILVETPDLGYGIMKQGEEQQATIPESDLYRVVSNPSIISGISNVVLELVDPDVYTWETTDDPQITINYYVHYVSSIWEEYPHIESWTYGEKNNTPKYKVSNSGLTISIYYRHVDGEFSKIVPTEVGDYEVKLVSNKDVIGYAPLEDVTLEFSIIKAIPECAINSVLVVPYGTTLNDIELLGLGDGTWKFDDVTNEVLKAGDHNVQVTFTPNDSFHYESVIKTINIKVEKVATSYTIPTSVNSLVYNAEEQQLITAGSVIGGQMYYKVNDDEWSLKIPSAKNAGIYTVYYKVVGDENHYDVDEQNLQITINKAPLIIKVNDATIEQFNDLPTFTWEIEGLYERDSMNFDPTFNVSTADTTVFGTYDVEIQNYEIDNYDITVENGKLVITEHTECRGGTNSCIHKAKCIICGKEYGITLDHVFEVYEYNHDATCTNVGTETAKCKTCDLTDTRTAEGSKLINHIDNNNDGQCDVCSHVLKVNEEPQSSNLGLGLIIGIGSTTVLAGCAYFFILRKRISK